MCGRMMSIPAPNREPHGAHLVNAGTRDIKHPSVHQSSVHLPVHRGISNRTGIGARRREEAPPGVEMVGGTQKEYALCGVWLQGPIGMGQDVATVPIPGMRPYDRTNLSDVLLRNVSKPCVYFSLQHLWIALVPRPCMGSRASPSHVLSSTHSGLA